IAPTLGRRERDRGRAQRRARVRHVRDLPDRLRLGARLHRTREGPALPQFDRALLLHGRGGREVQRRHDDVLAPARATQRPRGAAHAPLPRTALLRPRHRVPRAPGEPESYEGPDEATPALSTVSLGVPLYRPNAAHLARLVESLAEQHLPGLDVVMV